MGRSHYEVLGVLPNATPSEIKVAYRVKVRQVHPDSSVTLNSQSSSLMAEISEAWRVLSNAELRKRYDSGTSEKTTSDRFDVDPIVFAQPGVFPWKMVGSIFGFGLIVIFLVNVFSAPALPNGPDGLISGGSCVVVDGNQTAREVSCTEEHFGVARLLVGFDMTCPSDSQPYRDKQGMGIACVDPK